MYKLEKWRIFEAQFQSLWVWSVSSAWSIYFETQLQLLVLHYSGKLPVHLDFPSMSKFQIWRRISRWTPKTRVLAVSACHSISKIIFNVQDFSIKNQPALLNSDFPAFCTYQSLYVYQEKMKNNEKQINSPFEAQWRRPTKALARQSTSCQGSQTQRCWQWRVWVGMGMGSVRQKGVEVKFSILFNSHIQHLSEFTVTLWIL